MHLIEFGKNIVLLQIANALAEETDIILEEEEENFGTRMVVTQAVIGRKVSSSRTGSKLMSGLVSNGTIRSKSLHLNGTGDQVSTAASTQLHPGEDVVEPSRLIALLVKTASLLGFIANGYARYHAPDEYKNLATGIHFILLLGGSVLTIAFKLNQLLVQVTDSTTIETKEVLEQTFFSKIRPVLNCCIAYALVMIGIGIYSISQPYQLTRWHYGKSFIAFGKVLYGIQKVGLMSLFLNLNKPVKTFSVRRNIKRNRLESLRIVSQFVVNRVCYQCSRGGKAKNRSAVKPDKHALSAPRSTRRQVKAHAKDIRNATERNAKKELIDSCRGSAMLDWRVASNSSALEKRKLSRLAAKSHLRVSALFSTDNTAALFGDVTKDTKARVSMASGETGIVPVESTTKRMSQRLLKRFKSVGTFASAMKEVESVPLLAASSGRRSLFSSKKSVARNLDGKLGEANQLQDNTLFSEAVIESLFSTSTACAVFLVMILGYAFLVPAEYFRIFVFVTSTVLISFSIYIILRPADRSRKEVRTSLAFIVCSVLLYSTPTSLLQ